MQELIKQARNGDKEAFLELMRQNKAAMYRAAKAILKNDEDVADAMQDAYLSAFEHIIRLKNADYFKTWLMRILINKCCYIQ